MPRMVNGFRVAIIAGLALVLNSGLGEGAKFLQPPSRALAASPNRVAVVEAIQTTEDGVVFTVRESLVGEHDDERLTVRTSEGVRSRVQIGSSYVLGYTTLRRDPRRRSRDYQQDPAGPRIVSLPAVGEALLEDSRPVRLLVEAAASEVTFSDEEVLEAVLDQAARPDALSRDFALAELALRPSLLDEAGAAESERLHELAETGELDPRSLDYLLRAATPLMERGAATWMAESSRRVTVEYGSELDLRSAVPSLVETAIVTLGRSGEAGDLAVLEPHLASNNPAVGQAALEAMQALDAAGALEAVAVALERGGLHGDVERAARAFVEGS